MTSDRSESGPPGAGFPATHASMLGRAWLGDPAAREEFCEAYWRPLYAFRRRSGDPPETAQDRVGDFFLFLMEHDWNVLKRHDRAQGRFRAYLLVCFKNHCRDEWDREAAMRRGGGRRAVRLEATEEDERQVRRFESKGLTPDQAFDRAWAMRLLDRVYERVREDLRVLGRGPQLAVFEGFLAAEDPMRPGYGKLAEVSGLSEDGVRHALEELRKRIREALRQVLRDETGNDDEAGEVLALMG